jgi:GT2 family glycosyltransferase
LDCRRCFVDEPAAGLMNIAVGKKKTFVSAVRQSARAFGTRAAAVWHHPLSPERRKSRIARIEADWNRGPSYDEWIKNFDYSAARDRIKLSAEVASLSMRPLISILLPTYNTPSRYLNEAIGSVVGQVYPDWELCIADDASTNNDVHAVLAAWQERDRRIKVTLRSVNGHISAASNTALTLASGDYVTLLDHDDILPENALAELARVFEARPEAEIVYSDEDKIDVRGRRFDPHFKPDWSPDLFLAQNYLNHLSAYRTDTIRTIGGWREGLEGSQDYDLNLRILERIDSRLIIHIPKVLYHWRATPGSTALAAAEKTYAYAAGKRSLEEHLVRTGLPARVEDVQGSSYYRIFRPLPDPAPTVSLIIPTKDRVDVLRPCIESIVSKTNYQHYEILIVDNGSVESETLSYFASLRNRVDTKILSYTHPFNYAAMNNFAVKHSSGSIIGLINNDIEVISVGWLNEMVSHAVRPEIGCVGAKLYYPNDTLQHGGVILGLGGVAGHAYLKAPRRESGYFGRLRVCRNVSAVTAACLVVRREIFDAVGGFDEENFPIEFNDVDFCLRVIDAGYLNIWTPFAELYHRESVSRGRDISSPRFLRMVEAMKARWGARLKADPYYSPNLTLSRWDYGFRELE